MIRHMFKLMWNRRRRNLLLTLEILFSFLVFFAVGATAIGWGLQFLQPLGFNPDNILVLHVEWDEKVEGQVTADVLEAMRRMELEARAVPEVVDICWTYTNTPYSSSTWRSDFDGPTGNVGFDFIVASDSYADVLEIPLIEGSWYGREHDASAATPVVIGPELRELWFGDGPAVGQILTDDDKEYLISGVIDRFRYKGEFSSPRMTLFKRHTMRDTTAYPPFRALIKVSEGSGVMLERLLTDRLGKIVPAWSLRVENMQEIRSAYFKERMFTLLIPSIIGGFLVFNVALGLFGVLWYSINRRRSELGLRRALGATKANVKWQFTGEALVMAAFSLIVGIILAAQAPILSIMGPSVSTVAYILAIVVATALICLLVILCAWYPARLAARIHPAEALHDE